MGEQAGPAGERPPRRGGRLGDLLSRWEQAGVPMRAAVSTALIVAAAAAVALAALAATGKLGLGAADVDVVEVAESAGIAVPEEDPFLWEEGRGRELERDATAGNAHVLYEKSPDGVLASAKRTARFRDEIEAAAERFGTDPDLMEAIVFLESAGRPEVIAGDDPAAASGLAQIVASTGIDLLDMRIDLARSQAIAEQLTRIANRIGRLERERSRASGRRAAKLVRRLQRLERRDRSLRAERRRVDTRFDPEQALAGMGRYLEIAEDRFGVADLAVQSYHMGIGNLETVIDRYVEPGDTSGTAAEIVEREGLSYAQLYFDSSPIRNPRTWNLLSGFADESLNYYWKVLASREIMELYRGDRDELARLIELHAAKATAEEAFHPEEETEVFDDPDEVAEALDDGDLVAIPPGRAAGYRIGPQLGELAADLDVDPTLYRSLRPEALAVLAYISGKVRSISGDRRGRLILTSAVRDATYQEMLAGRNPEATAEYSLHTTGWAFDILRKYRNGAQAQAFQFALDRLRALGVIDYAVEPRAIHITASERAGALVD